MILTLLLLCFLLILLYYYYILCDRKFVQLIDKIPSVPSLPIFGHALILWMPSREDLWKLLHVYTNIYYPIWKLWLGPFAYVSICHPDDLEKVLSTTKHLEKGSVYTLLNPWLGTGLLTSKGTKWHEKRKILTPTFHFNILNQFVEMLIEEGNHMTQSLKNIEGSTVNDLVSFISFHTLNAICETTMGTSLHKMGEFQKQYRQAIYEMGEIILYRLIRPWFVFDTIFALTPMGRKQIKCLKILHEFTEKIIAERKRYHELTEGRYLKNFANGISNIETDDDEMLGVKKKRLAMLDLLISVAQDYGMSDLDIREEVDTFTFEGHDTVAMGITFAMLLLAEHKDIQECVRKEVNAIMQANDGKLSMSALNNMSYLERCLKESLRLYPSVPYMMRVSSEDVKLQSYLVPSGTTLFLNIYSTHRDPNFWPNPEIFDPDRFLPEKIQNRHSYSYIPFSAGLRNCIGQRFAMLEMKAIIAPLIYNFYLEPIDYLKDVRLKLDIINRPVHPIRLRCIPINHTPSTSFRTI
ncbi:cytochrome P450 4C1-like isoform X3 [Pogonomyrmex barbatus]|uniref:Cytochrome P450 4C1-like isoform X3 n=1 Tax=Pogonomyrmex barbatus TaxID=144034 RepID=A0A6I9W6I8_9HYME|nr:cytochrome P450 4C1-like isoform X3 [Pogonomyrmex barbatus]